MLDEQFTAYVSRRKGLSSKINYFVKNFFKAYNEKAFFAAAKYVRFIEGCGTATVFALKVRGATS